MALSLSFKNIDSLAFAHCLETGETDFCENRQCSSLFILPKLRSSFIQCFFSGSCKTGGHNPQYSIQTVILNRTGNVSGRKGKGALCSPCCVETIQDNLNSTAQLYNDTNSCNFSLIFETVVGAITISLILPSGNLIIQSVRKART